MTETILVLAVATAFVSAAYILGRIDGYWKRVSEELKGERPS